MSARPARTIALALLIFLTTALAGQQAWAGGPEGRRFGLGIILGEPSGLTAKLWLSDRNALDFLAAFDFSDEDFGFFVDYLFHFDIGIGGSGVDIPLYVGVGGKLLVHDDDHHHHDDWDDDDDIGLGIRIPIGLAFILTGAPFEFFIEVAPGLRLIPHTDGDVDGGIGARFYF